MFGKKPPDARKLNSGIGSIKTATDASTADPSGPDEQGRLLQPHALAFTSRRDENMRCVRKHSRAVYTGEGVVLCWALGRYKFYVQSTDVGFGAHLMLDGFWEMWVTEFIARCVREGMTVFDLGANHGYFTLLAAELVGAGGSILAVEPNPTVRQMLKQNVEVNGFSSRVTIDDRAVWSRTGEVMTFVIPYGEPKNGRVTDITLAGTEYSHIQVNSFALDDLKDQKVDFIKVDIEGGEEKMWAGMQALLARNPNVIVLMEFAATRCIDPRTVLEQMSEIFPLQYLDVWSNVQPISVDEVLSRTDDWMLVLSRNPLPPPQ